MASILLHVDFGLNMYTVTLTDTFDNAFKMKRFVG